MKIHGACPHDCPDTCGFITEVQDGRAVAFYPDPHNAITEGWLCAKVRPYLDHVYHPDRLTHPLRRTSPKDAPPEFERISWADAIAEIGQKWRAIIAEHGAEAILPYSYSGTLGMVQMGVASGRFWNRLGASQLERSICGAAAEQAVNLTLGARWSVPYEAVAHSQLVLIWGHNPVSTAPHFMPHLKKAQKNGTQVVVIDPRRTRTAKGADWHIQPRPATDGALALGLLHVIVRDGLHDAAWLAQHAHGWEQFAPTLANYPPEQVAEITGVAAEDIVKLAHLYATSKPSLLKFADGLQRHPNGGQTVRALCLLPAVTGQYGVLGGGLGYSTSGYVQWDSEAIEKWAECPPPGRWVNMNRLGAALMGEVSDPPIQSLFVFGANPASASPNAALIQRGLQRPDLFTVVHELFMTDTAAHADIILPATSQLEQWDVHKAYGHTQITLNEPAIAPLGECLSNWEVMRLLASEMGFDEPWLHQPAEEIIDEVLAATAVHQPALAGLSVATLRGKGAVPLAISPAVPYAGGRFPTSSGKVEVFCAALAELGAEPLPRYVPAVDDGGNDGRFAADLALNLITGAAHHFVTTSFGNSAAMRQHEGTPFVEIHPEDAAVRGVVDGQMVVVENGRGSVRLRAVLTDGVRRGVLVSPKGRWGNVEGGQVNATTPDALGDLAGQSTYHTNTVWVSGT
ncbi:MAG: molybdopterin-dependent oxidoreductase [Chloroflexi bacterium]|nr:molybdopterin-dependent oxidoreductase [Chloroflexota bacterium]